MNFYQLIWHYNPPDSIQSHPNTLQTPYRHPPDTPQTPQNEVLFGVGGHWEKRQYDDFYSTVYDLYDICTPPDICQTPPDMIQTPSDTHRHHPQGSRLGPLLFLVYMNDIVVDLESKPYIFADDCTLISTASSTFETTNMLSRDLTKISNWAHIWKINFNPQKSKHMIFSKAQLLARPVIMDITIIERVYMHKHLGIFLTSDLTWDKQIAHISKKVNLKLSIMWSVKELSRQCLDLLCKLHVRASIDYCITVFGPCLNQLQIKNGTKRSR